MQPHQELFKDKEKSAIKTLHGSFFVFFVDFFFHNLQLPFAIFYNQK